MRHTPGEPTNRETNIYRRTPARKNRKAPQYASCSKFAPFSFLWPNMFFSPQSDIQSDTGMRRKKRGGVARSLHQKIL